MVALVTDMDDPDANPIVFSAKFACPSCGYSTAELEPRMFSFNNPAGACSSCDGLGVTQFFDEALVVADPDLSLAEGAIRGWDRRNIYYFHMLSSLADHFGFDVEVPFKKLSKKHQDVILHGSGRQQIDFIMPTIAAISYIDAIVLKAYYRIWSGVFTKPNRLWCGRTYKSTYASLTVRIAGNTVTSRITPCFYWRDKSAQCQPWICSGDLEHLPSSNYGDKKPLSPRKFSKKFRRACSS